MDSSEQTVLSSVVSWMSTAMATKWHRPADCSGNARSPTVDRRVTGMTEKRLCTSIKANDITFEHLLNQNRLFSEPTHYTTVNRLFSEPPTVYRGQHVASRGFFTFLFLYIVFCITVCISNWCNWHYYALLCTGQLLVHPVALLSFFIPSVFMLIYLISLHYVNGINKVMMMMMMIYVPNK